MRQTANVKLQNVFLIFTKLLNYYYLYSLNAWILVHPWWLCCDWSMGCVPVIMTPFDLRILGGVALWLVLGALLFSGLKPPITREQRYGNLSCLFCKFCRVRFNKYRDMCNKVLVCCLKWMFNLGQLMRLCYLSHMRPAKAQASLRQSLCCSQT